MSFTLLALSVLLHTVVGMHNRRFPPGFQFGAATSAYQVEGAWNVSDGFSNEFNECYERCGTGTGVIILIKYDKGESIWDTFSHEHLDIIVDHTTGDVACDSYHQWRQDVQIAHNLGLNFYRFSIAWSRLLPTGLSNVVSKTGASYYNNLINGLLEKNIEPLITMYHWDLPQRLQNLGGWTNPLITDWFAEYADVVFKLYGNRVKTWVTINEANLMCDYNYNTGILAPRIKDADTAAYLCNKHVLIAHAKAWRLYDRKYRYKYHGSVTLAHHIVWMDPLTADDEEIAELAREHSIGRYTHPIHSEDGGWPPSVEKAFAKYSKDKGFSTSRLPSFTTEERLLVRGTYDYVAINYYTSRLARKARPGENPGVFFDTGAPELGIILEKDPKWPFGGHTFVPIYPKGLRLTIDWMRKKYGDLNFFISENGFANQNSDLNDFDRIEYYKLHLEQVLNSIHEDGANVTGFTAWTLLDNFEWTAGHTLKFGLYHVDFSDPERKRTPKASAHFYADLIKRRTLDVPAIKYLNKQKHQMYNSNIRTTVDLTCLLTALVLACRQFI